MATMVVVEEPTQFSPELLRQMRESAGHTRESLARAVDVSVFSVRDWECKKYVPSVKRLAALADALGCSLADFFVGGVDG
jgi:DNA-binding XRE family transcriptional regulator